MRCDKCGGVVGPSDVFCPVCAASLTVAVTATVPARAAATTELTLPRFRADGTRAEEAVTVLGPTPNPNPFTLPPARAYAPAERGRVPSAPPPVPVPGSGSAPGSVPVRHSPGFARGATRYLCAAVQLDSGINATVIRALIHDRHRAIAYSPGVDLATVLKYALAARTRKLTTDALLFAELIAGAWLAVQANPWLPAAIAALWGTVFTELRITHRKVLQPRLRRSNYDPQLAPEPTAPHLRARAEEIAARCRTDNVTVSAGFDPFAGYGVVDMDYSAVVDLARSAPGAEPRQFTIHELVERLEQELTALDLPGVSVASRVLVHGRDLAGHADSEEIRQLLPDPLTAPVSQVDATYISGLRTVQTGPARPYLTIRVTGWSGEVVSTLFVRLQLLPGGGQLLIGLSRAVLPPLRASFHQADTRPGLLRLLGTSLVKTPRDVLASGPRILDAAARAMLRPLSRARQAWQIREGVFNYGPRWAPRELASLPVIRIPARRPQGATQARAIGPYHRYFQESDRALYAAAVERKLFSVLGTFLTDHGIAADELDARWTAVQNLDLKTGAGRLAAGDSPEAERS